MGEFVEDLFSPSITPLSSGSVPREVFRGIVWTQDHEAEFDALVREAFSRFPGLANVDWYREKVRQSTVWSIEIRMIQKVVADRVRVGMRCMGAEEKGAFIRETKEMYGDVLFSDVQKALVDYGLRKVVLESWG